MRGVDSRLFCGRGPKLSARQRHATRRFLTLSRVICSSGEYFVLPRSPPQCGHSPFRVPVWPNTIMDAASTIAPSEASVATVRADLLTMGNTPLRSEREEHYTVCELSA